MMIGFRTILMSGLPDGPINYEDPYKKWWRCPVCFHEQSKTLFPFFRSHEEGHRSQHAPSCEKCDEIMEPLSPREKP